MIPPGDVGLSASRLDRIVDVMARHVEEKRIPGAVTLVARRGEIVHHEAVGYRFVEEEEPMDTEVVFRIASMAKPITCAAAMILWEEGRFRLSDPIRQYLPEFEDMDVAVHPDDDERLGAPYKRVPAETPVTVRHLMTHTAGLPNPYRGPTRHEYLEAARFHEDEETVADFVRRLAELPLNFEPGERWEYSRANDVVGRLVEVLTGGTLGDFLRQRLFGPLDMEDTHYYLPESKLDRFAAQYEPDENGEISLVDAPDPDSYFVAEPHTYEPGSGGLLSTSRDYYRFQRMMLNGGRLDDTRLLSPRTVRLMTANHTGDRPIWLRGPGYGYGLGYGVKTELGASGTPSAEGSFGWGGRFCTYSWVDPDDDLIGVVLTQLRPNDHLPLSEEFQTLTYAAVID